MATFLELAQLCEGLAETRSRLELARRVADFVSTLAQDEVAAAVRLLLGQAGRGEAGVSGGTLWRVLGRLAGDEAAPERAWEGAVDFGEAVERLLATRPRAIEAPRLSILEVAQRVQALAAPRGAGSRAAKERLLVALFDALTPLAGKYVARNLVREMRMGAAEGIVIDALAVLAGGDREAVARAHMLEGDLATVAARVRSGGVLASGRSPTSGHSARCWPRPPRAPPRRS